MSYILDAIKKADQKRKLGSVPDVHTVHESPAAPSNRLMWPYLLAAGLFINAAIITIWLQPWAAKEPTVTAAKQEQVSENNEKELQKPVAEPEEIKGDADESSMVSEIDQTAIDDANQFDPATEKTKTLTIAEQAPPPPTSTQGIITPIEEQPPTDQEQEVIAEQPDEDTVEQDQEEALPELLDEADQKPRFVGRIGGTSLANKDNSTEVDLITEQEREEEKRQLSRIPFMFQLPATVKNSLPDIHVSFHSYSNRPSSRLVSINGKILREGQDFEKDLTLEKITESGVVILFKSRRFRIDL